MRYPVLLIYESDGMLARILRPLAEKERWLLREPRQIEACLRLVQRASKATIVVKVEPDVEQSLALVRGVFEHDSALPIIAVMDRANPELAGIAWHLGASFVLSPPLAREQLPGLVESLMKHHINKSKAQSGSNVLGSAESAKDPTMPENEHESK